VTRSSHPTPIRPLNWRALSDFPDLLVRRSADPDEWVIAARRSDGPTFFQPQDEGAWAGYLAFGHRDVIDRIPSRFPEDNVPSARWWRPEVLLKGGSADFNVVGDTAKGAADNLLQQLRSTPVPREDRGVPAQWERRTSKDRYLASVKTLLDHIQRGDIYEVNYCTERTAILTAFDPFAAFDRLIDHTDAPFAALYRQGDFFALCMSPEHFLRVEDGRVTTRPMKGTRRRSSDAALDASLVRELLNDPKERSENIMAVDVARHDLSRIAASGSVRVHELCAVKSYPNVHQLVSTVSADLRDGLRAWDAVRAAFPMASMTGAPKRSALRLIDAVEDMPRGLFSGSFGYQLPGGTLDLNVVIRTITYDASTGRASLITGSAITALSDPEQEWAECELKAMSVLNALVC
jgi:para-aminobenzoate synthetase component 1